MGMREMSGKVPAGLIEQAAQELERWLALAAELEGELGRPEPDAARVVALLEGRMALQQRLMQLAGDAAPDVWREAPRLRELAEAILARDRAAMERARAVRAECLRHLGDIQKRREMAAGYRRALNGALVVSPHLCDKQV